VQRDFFARDVLRSEAREELWREVQACGGSGDGAFGGLEVLVGMVPMETVKLLKRINLRR
jgi:hypothetical protein